MLAAWACGVRWRQPVQKEVNAPHLFLHARLCEMRVGTVSVGDCTLEEQGNRVRAVWWVCMVAGLLCAVVVVSSPVVHTKACCHVEHIYIRTHGTMARTTPPTIAVLASLYPEL